MLVNTVDTWVTTTAPHASVAVTKVTSGAGITALHVASASVAGHVIVGGVTSTVRVINCVHVAELPHASVAR